MTSELLNYINDQCRTLYSLQEKKEKLLRDTLENIFDAYPFVNLIRIETTSQPSYKFADASKYLVVEFVEVLVDRAKMEGFEELLSGKLDKDDSILVYAEEDWPEIYNFAVNLYCHDLELGCMTFTRERANSIKAERQAAVEELTRQSQEMGLYD